MKKYLTIPLAGLLVAGVGFLLRGRFGITGGCLMLAGLFFFFGGIAYGALRMTEKRCPACKKRIQVLPAGVVSVKEGMISCPHCRAVVRVAHLTQR